MSPRSIRRAAERRARKLERKRTAPGATAARHDEAAFLSEPKIQGNDAAERKARKEQNRDRQEAASSISPAQLAANRHNAQLSTGPTSETGKRTSSLNAVKTGLTGRTVLLPLDDAEIYRRHLAAYEAEYKPVGLRECELVQSLADTQWRLNRIPGLEMAIYALGRTELEGSVEDEKIELQTYLKYEKSLRNLQLQESRLLRRYQREMAELRALQKDREVELASNFQAAGQPPLTRTANSEPEASAPSVRLDQLAKFSSAPMSPLHPDSFALPSSPCGNFPGPASVD